MGRANKDRSRRARLVACFVGGIVAFNILGCAPSEPPRFTPGASVSALASAAETEEDKKLMQGLQDKIAKEVATLSGSPLAPKALPGAELSTDRLEQGAEIFARRCEACHGVNGDGAGPVAQYLKPLPRDYTKGIFKFVSTPLGSRPRRSDLIRTIRRGVTGTSMPSFAELAPDEVEAVVDYVIFLSQRGQLERELAMLAEQELELPEEGVSAVVQSVVDPWKQAQLQAVMPATTMPPFTPESIAKGKELFAAQACNKCHGLDGRGGTFGGLEVGSDVWGHKAAAADLTSGMFHGGGRPIDLYRRIYVGINGTPMPSFANIFEKSPENIWHLVHFIRDMGERRRNGLPPIQVPAATPAGQPAPQPPEKPVEADAVPKAAAIEKLDTTAS